MCVRGGVPGGGGLYVGGSSPMLIIFVYNVKAASYI